MEHEINLTKLTDPLTREDIDFRAAQVVKAKDNVWCTILAYKDARVDMKRLDEAVGALNWQNAYQRDSKGVLQCGIAIINTLLAAGERWIWKWSNGTPSDFESEKGEYSDAFKRAGFMWGIGRQLYDFPAIWIQLNEGDYYEKDGKTRLNSKFRPNDWLWEISDDYKSVTAKRKLGGKMIQVYNSNPYKNDK